jgi:D-alanine-D-alanine ligase
VPLREGNLVTAGERAYPPVAVLLGGPSAEHDVSIVSGTAIAEALIDAGLEVRQILIDLDGMWWWLPADHRRADRPGSDYDDPTVVGGEKPFSVGAALDLLASGDPPPLVFIALHGPFGEDGTVQALLEARGLAYTGAGVLASALGMDKAAQKRIWRGLGLPVIDWLEVRAAAWQGGRETVLAQLDAFAGASSDGRLMIKPARLGSSVGMTLAHAPSERAAAVETAFRYDDLAVVERYLPEARDLEVSIIGTEPPLGVYGPGEVIAGHEFYDYEAKYTPGLSETSTRAEIPNSMREGMKKLARDAYRALGTEGFARVDFLVRGEQVFISEINTIPGFTPISLFPTMPAEAGLDFTAVCLRIIDLALARHEARSRLRLTTADLPR